MNLKNYRLLLGASLGLGFCSIAEATVTFNFDTGDGGFASTLNTAAFDGPWIYGATSGAGGSGGWSTDGQGPENSHPNTTDLTSGILGVVATGSVVLSFDHRFSFEDPATAWDGGAVFIGVNGGAFTQLPLGSFTANGYNGAILAGSASELASLPGFVATSADYAAGTFITSVANLGTFDAGTTLEIRFRAAYDTNTTGGSPDWALDNVVVTNVVPEPSAVLVGSLGLLGLLRRRRP